LRKGVIISFLHFVESPTQKYLPRCKNEKRPAVAVENSLQKGDKKQ